MRRKSNTLPKLHIRKNDTVKVLSGEDRGTVGRVLRVNPTKRIAIVEGVNLVKKHIKPNEQHREGAIISKEAPVHICKLMLIDPANNKPTRTGRKKTEKGWELYSKKTGQIINRN